MVFVKILRQDLGAYYYMPHVQDMSLPFDCKKSLYINQTQQLVFQHGQESNFQLFYEFMCLVQNEM